MLKLTPFNVIPLGNFSIRPKTVEKNSIRPFSSIYFKFCTCLLFSLSIRLNSINNIFETLLHLQLITIVQFFYFFLFLQILIFLKSSFNKLFISFQFIFKKNPSSFYTTLIYFTTIVNNLF